MDKHIPDLSVCPSSFCSTWVWQHECCSCMVNSRLGIGDVGLGDFDLNTCLFGRLLLLVLGEGKRAWS